MLHSPFTFNPHFILGFFSLLAGKEEERFNLFLSQKNVGKVVIFGFLFSFFLLNFKVFLYMMMAVVVVKKQLCCPKWWIVVVRHLLLLLLLLLPTTLVSSSSSSNSKSNHHGNPANDLVDIINKNRTAQKLPQLNDSPGLGCMALQYVDLCKDNCTSDGVVNCKPPENDFTEVFAPNCGVELPTFGTITGHILGCQAKYVEPSLAFSDVLVKDSKSLSIMRNKSHLEVGVGLVEVHKGPFFWCILFSDGKANSTFVLEDNGKGIQQKKGCFSGSSFPCSSSGQRSPVLFIVTLHICLLQLYFLYQTWFLPKV